ncbi:salicylate hydroxylase [Zhengella mangrovi]|uniref:Salicylate hydroxylase n=1 Tax=Zhengella mangrovi TaxID=1982044 RepID=A0A2G1QN80_9HYPH|nr:FAD-dependent monooxygenase [Zhengella mangrovi]PHP66921.1 salicylate hydroxylase [Zhengella mangrovi]
MTRHGPILIAGAGIAGLTAALALARGGHAVRVFERAPELSEVGAGLQLSPNATRVLAAVGVTGRLLSAATAPDAVVLRRGQAMRELTRVPLGAKAEARWGAPYLVIHRADLHGALTAAAAQQPLIEIVTGATVADFASHPRGLTLSVDRDGRVEETVGRMLVAADGVWSRLRGLVPGAGTSAFTGHVAWRATIPADGDLARSLGDLLSPAHVTAFMAPEVHLVAYPISAGRRINLVGLMTGEDYGQKWAASADPSPFIAVMDKASPALGRMAREAGPWVAWALHAVGPGAWQDGKKVVLIGDAAHATTPFAAQGAAMAIEDAGALAHALSEAKGDTAEALPRWEAARKARVARVVRRGAFNHFTWHARGPIALGRDVVLKLRKPEQLMADFDWLYGWRVGE